MCNFQFISILTIITAVFSEQAEGPKPVLQRTVTNLFLQRYGQKFPGVCQWLQASPPQAKLCHRDSYLPTVLYSAKHQAISHCESAFEYDRWNCSYKFHRRSKKNIFDDIYRETAYIYALEAASLTHSIARSCASGGLIGCACTHNIVMNNSLSQWKVAGCSDDIKFGKRLTRKILQLKKAGSDLIASILKQNVAVGMDAVSQQMHEVCKCHGFSGSCTMKSCWRRVSNFNSTVMLLKRQYHHAERKKILNTTSKRAVRSKKLNNFKNNPKNQLLYLQKTPNLCKGTQGRQCRDPGNCATLCCGRGYVVSRVLSETKCRCRMINCCQVKCDTCKEKTNVFTCK